MGPERAQASGASEKAMLHSILVGAVFTAMVLAPCVFAMFSTTHNSEETK
jgi:hypothetical protein